MKNNFDLFEELAEMTKPVSEKEMHRLFKMAYKYATRKRKRK